MNEELQLKLQACLDGELPEGEARDVADLLAQNAEAAALFAELNNTRRALKEFDSEIKLPESRDFYWSKIEREIGRLERPQTIDDAPAWLSALLRRFLAPAGVLAALVIAALLIIRQPPAGNTLGGPETETAFADADAFTYRDYTAGTTLVWLSYPAENGFADFGPGDTLE
jgi:anti-sigma factor RsiW